jgi:hypothetical protein
MKTFRSKKIPAAVVLAAVITVGCTVPSWVTTVENDATLGASIALSLVTVIDPTLIPLVSLIQTGLNALEKVINDFKAQPTATNLQAVQAAANAVEANVQQLESAAQVKNAASATRITAVVTVLVGAVDEIISQIPPSAAAAALGVSNTTQKPKGAKYWKDQYNKAIKGNPQFRPLK